MPTIQEQAEHLVLRAKIAVMLRIPFYSNILFNLQFEQDDQIPTACTNSKILKYNPEWISKLTKAEVCAILCHEALHVALLHVFRLGNKEPVKWNMACDYAVNPLLRHYGEDITLPKGALYSRTYEGMSAEEIYNLLPDDPTPPAASEMIGNMEQPEGSKSDIQKQEQEWKVKIAQSQSTAGKLPADLDRLLDKAMETMVPWEELLSRFLTQVSQNDYSWKMPNPRYTYMDTYLPQLRTPSLGQIAVIIDTSGSINQQDLDIFASELRSIISSYPDTEINVLYVDTKVSGHQIVNINELELKPHGGGGTDFSPGFEYLDKNGIDPVCVIYFTDGECYSFPDTPDASVLWMINGRLFKPPFGEVIYMNKRG